MRERRPAGAVAPTDDYLISTATGTVYGPYTVHGRVKPSRNARKSGTTSRRECCGSVWSVETWKQSVIVSTQLRVCAHTRAPVLVRCVLGLSCGSSTDVRRGGRGSVVPRPSRIGIHVGIASPAARPKRRTPRLQPRSPPAPHNPVHQYNQWKRMGIASFSTPGGRTWNELQ